MAIRVGDMQRDTIGFLFSIQCKIKSLTSFITVPFGPVNAQSLKFLAAPKPPGIKREEISFLSNLDIEIILPLAILEDSTNTFLFSLISSPFK